MLWTSLILTTSLNLAHLSRALPVKTISGPGYVWLGHPTPKPGVTCVWQVNPVAGRPGYLLVLHVAVTGQSLLRIELGMLG